LSAAQAKTDCRPPTLLLHLEPLPMRRLFRTVAADRHAAPSARPASRV